MRALTLHFFFFFTGCAFPLNRTDGAAHYGPGNFVRLLLIDIIGWVDGQLGLHCWAAWIKGRYLIYIGDKLA